ncbi:EmrB/QacA subfamily drug resistance transporter [Herbihabitans rhizosphaerae]|uniref:EmrB/QacA subfamily drug resistance transporter n=1 Tax=Herbihabitans rhizosphaerae TaxID=1872711 RepID=A0A4Q7KVN1_9PSEU|nr:DHA2 family efflux MFS transporter permease subunit [Herbihabitans rhizosphaerae]RZS40774.1 EmrB/QacA subfamily drug resistance transporter [Herbihabitans rhizosphaerae]
MPETIGTTSRSRWVALVVLCAGMLMIILDQTIVTVALPAIQNDLGFTQSGLAWVVNAYLIALGGLLLLAGRLGDLIGRKRVFLAGVTMFTAASVLCGVAGNAEWLVIARFLQGAGGALTSAVILGMIVTMFPEQREQARAIGVFSFVAAAGASIGLLAGGVLTEAINWHWIFFVNVPIGVVVGVLAARIVPADEGLGLREGADVIGAVLVTSALMLGVYTIVETESYGWGHVHTISLGALSLALLAGFVVRQARAAKPLLPLRIFRSRNVSGANLIQVLMMAGLLSTFTLGALYLKLQDYDALDIGLAFLPVAVLIAAMSLGASARLNSRFGERRVLIAGLVLITAGLLLFARVPVVATYASDLLPVMLLIGFGVGLAFPAIMTLAMSGASEHEAGLASGLANTTQQVGGALGLTVLTTVATGHTESLRGSGDTEPVAMTGGYHLAFGIGGLLVIVGIALAVAVLRPVPQEQVTEHAPDDAREIDAVPATESA